MIYKESMSQIWLLKSEPTCYSIEDLEQDQQTYWDGIRNYQARNFIKNDIKIGDIVLFYHSNANPPGIAGLAKVSSPAKPDFTALDPTHDHYDPKSSLTTPIWWMIDIQFVEKFKTLISLKELHTHPELIGMPLLQKGSRLSVQPVSEPHFNFIKRLSQR